MKVRLFTCRFDSEAGAFDDAELRAFMEGHEVLEMHHEFFTHDREPWVMLVVGYRPGEGVGRRATLDAPRRSGRERPWEDLTPEEKERYDALHRWRSARSKIDGAPVYVILVNRQMAAIARANATSLAALQAVDGFGAGRAERYGEDILKVLAALGEPRVSPSVEVPR